MLESVPMSRGHLYQGDAVTYIHEKGRVVVSKEQSPPYAGI